MKYLLLCFMVLTASLSYAANPTLKITAPVQNLNVGASTTVTFTWSEAVTDFTLSDINISGGGIFTSALSGSGTTYTVTFQKTTSLNTVSLIVDNNATTPAGHGATLGFNIAPKIYIKDGNAFLGKFIEAVPQPRCPMPGEILVDASGNPTTRVVENYFVLGKGRVGFVPEQLRSHCLTRLLGGQKFIQKTTPKANELINVHGMHRHDKLMPKVNYDFPNPLSGTTKVRVKPHNLSGCTPDGSGKYTCLGTGDARFENEAAKFAADDPILYPGQKDAAHLHVFYGNNNVNHNTNTASLVNGAISTFAGGTANNTGYWAPAAIDTATNKALVPGNILIYYKGHSLQGMHLIKPLPQGLKIIAGNPAAATAAEQTQDPVSINCVLRGGGSEEGTTVFGNCSGDIYDHVRITVNFPDCVADDGFGNIKLDSPDHRSHLAYSNPNNYSTVPNRCPPGFPHRIAGISQLIYYYLEPGQNTSTWRLSSDNYSASLPGGASSHADWWGGWKVYWANRLNTQCTTQLINCGVNYIGLNDGVAIASITTSGTTATITTVLPHRLKISNPDGTYPDTVGNSNVLNGRISGVTGTSAALYNFDPTKVTNTHADYTGSSIIPIASQPLKIINATQIEYQLPSTPASTVVNVSGAKLQWGEQFCSIGEACGNDQSYSDFYYGDKE